MRPFFVSTTRKKKVVNIQRKLKKISDSQKKNDNSGSFKPGHQPANKGKTLSCLRQER